MRKIGSANAVGLGPTRDVQVTAFPLSHASPASARPTVRGKSLFVGDTKLFVRGVTYGTFRLDDDGRERFDPEVVERDFEAMAENGVNAVRTYTVPPRWLLDAALRHGLYVMVGVPWEQHIAFLDDSRRDRSIEQRVREGVRACAGHPAVLCYAVGSEIPAPIVRWEGRRRMERFVERLYRAAKEEDPDALVTYVNYPSTEYLSLPFVDFVCFNVYLESRERFEAYLARLQNLTGDKPLLMAEVGLDSRRHGEARQAELLDWQLRACFTAGCAGAFVFAWTDEWHRGGSAIEDWDFGLTRRDRTPKPALAAARRAFAEIPFRSDVVWPRISVVVCTYNGAKTLAQTLAGVERLDYPDYEVIVVDDGSTDETAAIAAQFRCRLVRTANRGLSSARNTGCEAATGEIVAYLDDDAWPDRHWLRYLAAAFLRTPHAAVGGPNIPPPDDGVVAQCVARAPGGPIHVLLSDEEAEHIPGCNMAIRRDCLEAIGGFDPQFTVAGDDVDLCWRLQDRGWTLGYAPAAVVWHRRRRSVRGYWRQQRSYGKAEALLERKWPERYNALGHVSWSGRVYGGGLAEAILRRAGRIYHGIWGTAPFQSIYQPAPGVLRSLPMMPDWYLAIFALGALASLGSLWRPLLVALPLLALALAVPLVQTLGSAAAGQVPGPGTFRARLVIAALHFLQPLARLVGRLQYGLTPWRRRGGSAFAFPRPRRSTAWSESWSPPEARVQAVEAALRARGARLVRGGPFDRWDLEVRAGMLGSARLLSAVEEHGAGRQLTRFRVWPRVASLAVALVVTGGMLALAAGLDGATAASAILAGVTALFAVTTVAECSLAVGSIVRAIGSHTDEPLADRAYDTPPGAAGDPEPASAR
jgi:GT2 family glycosyltransferase